MTAKPVTPDAERGRQAVTSIARCIMVALGAGFVGAGGVLTGFAGLIALLAGKGAMALMVSGGVIATATGTGVAAALRMKYVFNRDQVHLQELENAERRKTQEKERQAIAAKLAAEREKERKIQERAAQVEFNAQAATKLKKDIKTMRPLKFGPKAAPQP